MEFEVMWYSSDTMSYDLYFRKKEQQKLSLNEFKEYFEPRQNYKVEDKEAFYQNENTGVYFSFNHQNVDTADKDSGTPISSISLNLNFFRPHVFALEAEIEVANLVKTFEFLIEDPQFGGNTSDVYNSEDFIRGWNAGNKVACESIGKSNPEVKSISLPAADIEKYWRWNYNLNLLREEKGENIFVPRILFHLVNGEVKSFVTWSDAIATVFPFVDTVIVYRDELATAKSFSIGKEPDLVTLSYNEVLPILNDAVVTDASQQYKTFQPDLVSFEQYLSIRKWVTSLKTSPNKPEVVSVDRIMDKELVN
ncbi:hypothetical protein HY405_00465 [Candidatus Microgenomates bacterium]|nr:hypothetical protein [Candidatus Microgenomates bacterium]